VKERVEALRGRLSIVSEPQLGTTIHVSVPVGEGGLETYRPVSLGLEDDAG